MIKAAVPALMFVAAVAGPASAAFFDGNDLYEACQSKTDSFGLGYMSGVTDFARVQFKGALCISPRVKAGQVYDLFCAYLTKHPEKRHLPAQFLAAYALTEAFPCQK